MKWSDFETRLRGEHLAGKRITVTIARIEIEEVHPRPGVTMNAPVMYFRNSKKSLVLSPENQRALMLLFGDDVAASTGKSITLEAKAMKVAGRAVLPIRIYAANGTTGDGEIREPQPAAGKEESAPSE